MINVKFQIFPSFQCNCPKPSAVWPPPGALDDVVLLRPFQLLHRPEQLQPVGQPVPQPIAPCLPNNRLQSVSAPARLKMAHILKTYTASGCTVGGLRQLLATYVASTASIWCKGFLKFFLILKIFFLIDFIEFFNKIFLLNF